MVSFAPGPTQLHPLVAPTLTEALDNGWLSRTHRSPWFSEIIERTSANLKFLLGAPDTSSVFFVSSATEAMERTLQNLVDDRTGSSHHYVNGAFSERFCSISKALGNQVTMAEVATGEGIDLGSLPYQPSDLVCLTHNETSTGACTPADEINSFCVANPDQLVAVDAVSSCPYAPLDLTRIDALFFSVQKCFGLPAGLGVIVVSERARERAAVLRSAGALTGTYHSFETLGHWADQHQTPETPNILGILLLDRVVEDYLSRGISTLRQETDEKNRLICETVEQHERLSWGVPDSRFRSPTVHAVEFNGDAFQLRAALKERGFEVGAGYLEKKATQSRIANFPMHTMEQYRAMCSALTECASL